MIYIQISHLFLKALTTLIKGFPKIMAQWLPEILPSIWNIFTQSADMYPFQSAWKFLSLKTCQYILKNDLNNFFISTIQGSELEKRCLFGSTYYLFFPFLFLSLYAYDIVFYSYDVKYLNSIPINWFLSSIFNAVLKPDVLP